MKAGDTVRMTESRLARFPPIVAEYMRDKRWIALMVDKDSTIEVRQIGGHELVSWVKASNFEEAKDG